MSNDNSKDALLPKTGVRANAKAQSREALIQAALVLMPSRGLDVSLDELCAQAGYTRGAFYQHFENRDQLIAAATGRVTEALLKMVVDQFSGESARDLTSIAETLIGLMRRGEYPIGQGGVMRSWQLLQACERSADVKAQYLGIFDKSHTMFSELIKRTQSDGKFPVGLRAEALATLCIATVVGLRTLHDVGVPLDLDGALALVVSSNGNG